MVVSRSSAVVAPDGTASRVLSVCSGITRQRAVSAVRVGGDGSLGEGCGGLGPWKSALKPRCMPSVGMRVWMWIHVNHIISSRLGPSGVRSAYAARTCLYDTCYNLWVYI